MKAQLIKALSPHATGEGHNLEAWAERQARLINSFAFTESDRRVYLEAAVKDAKEILRKGLKLK